MYCVSDFALVTSSNILKSLPKFPKFLEGNEDVVLSKLCKRGRKTSDKGESFSVKYIINCCSGI